MKSTILALVITSVTGSINAYGAELLCDCYSPEHTYCGTVTGRTAFWAKEECKTVPYKEEKFEGVIVTHFCSYVKNCQKVPTSSNLLDEEQNQ